MSETYSPEEWLLRLDAEMDTRICGMAELCPTCWKPMTALPGMTVKLTGRAGCSCGTFPTTLRVDRLRIHGVLEVVRSAEGIRLASGVGEKTSRRRPD